MRAGDYRRNAAPSSLNAHSKVSRNTTATLGRGTPPRIPRRRAVPQVEWLAAHFRSPAVGRQDRQGHPFLVGLKEASPKHRRKGRRNSGYDSTLNTDSGTKGSRVRRKLGQNDQINLRLRQEVKSFRRVCLGLANLAFCAF